ncbi:MAG: hypothetical protein D5R97_05165 [Candidatus Syntrophonatronum acetioxidans]|uniref:Methionine synthase n=1 Tax=Candidatus Syntrophonatronum acetioxidans TaxID=1795816 RepID=A0A424YEJ8_9FIRM|nr:MAG: hypothetical protein D5R97_05165 [Candidatus Syntrophonatronum acetioxidans]
MGKTRVLATGIGSLPDMEDKKALELIEKTFPLCPHWPQFPTREGESCIHQCFYKLIETGIMTLEEGKGPRLLTQSSDFPDKMARFYEFYLEKGEKKDLDGEMVLPRERAQGFYSFLEHLEKNGTGKARYLKGQLMAPLTAGMNIIDEEGSSAFYDEQWRDLLVKNLELYARWQIRRLSKYELPVIIFLDEGMMQAYGNREFLSLQGEWIKDSFKTIMEVIKGEGAVPGIHACSTADWEILISCAPGIINLDAYNYFNSLLGVSHRLNDFLQGGGAIAWGLVPAEEACFQETKESLRNRLEKYMESLIKRGVKEDLLTRKLIITPSCGTGLYSPELAERVYRLTEETIKGLDF